MNASFQFKDYHIDKIIFDNNIAPVNADDDNDSGLNIQFELEVALDDTDMKARVLLNANIFSRSKKDGDQPPILSTRIAGFFEQDGSLSPEEFRARCEMNGAATLFPFLRSAVADVTRITNMGPVLILPLINVHKMLGREKA